jgi:hypothetical protein
MIPVIAPRVAFEKTAGKRSGNCSGSRISQHNNPSHCNELLGWSYFWDATTDSEGLRAVRQARLIQRKFCVSRREISLGKNRFARNRGVEETLAKPHGHAIAIRGSNAAKAAFLVSMLRKRDSRFARNDGGKRLS